MNKLTLGSQAHWLVAQKANTRPKPAKELAYPNIRTSLPKPRIKVFPKTFH